MFEHDLTYDIYREDITFVDHITTLPGGASMVTHGKASFYAHHGKPLASRVLACHSATARTSFSPACRPVVQRALCRPRQAPRLLTVARDDPIPLQDSYRRLMWSIRFHGTLFLSQLNVRVAPGQPSMDS